MRLLSWLFLRYFGDCVPDQEMADRMVANINVVAEEDARRARVAATGFVRATHPHAFRSGEWGQIVGVSEMAGRPTWLVVWPDGATDEWVAGDPNAGYEFSAEAAGRV